MKKVFLGLVIVLMITVFSLAGCKAEEAVEEAVETIEEETVEEEVEEAVELKDIKIGVSMLIRGGGFPGELEKGLIDSAKDAEERGYKVELIITDGNFNAIEQLDQVNTFINQEADAIIVWPCSPVGAVEAIDNATEAGIPVVTIDTAAEGGDIESHISTDNLKAGRLAAQWVNDNYQDKVAKVGLIEFSTNESCISRIEGFVMEVDEKNFTNIEIVSRLAADMNEADAMNVAETILQANPDLDVIYCSGDPQAIGALAAVENAGMQDQVAVGGVDANEENLDIMKEGRAIKFEIAQKPYEIGYQGITALIDVIDGKTVEKMVYIDPILVTLDNVDTFKE